MSDDVTLDDFTDTEANRSRDKQKVVKPTSWGRKPEEWVEKSIEEVTELVTDGSHNPPKRVEDGIQIISGQNVRNGQINFDKEPSYITPSDFDQMDNNHSIEEGDLLMTIVGSIGRSAIVGEETDFALQRSIALIRTNNRVSTRFLKSVTDSKRFHRQSDSRSRATAQGGLYLEALNKIKVPVPPLSEQHKIATVLFTVDQAIEKTERVIEQIDVVQQGLLRSLFGKDKQERNTDVETKTERLGPKEFQVPTTWEVTDIASIGRVVTGDTPSTDNESNFGGSLPFVTPKTLSQGKYVTESDRTLSETGRSEAKPIPEGSVMMDCIGSDMGKVAISGCEVATNQQINAVVIEDSSYLPEFLYYHLNVLSDFIKSQAGQTATPIVNKSSFESFVIFNPPIEEQEEIVDTLSLYDKGKQSNIDCLTGLKRLKQGVQQDLLSGTVRATDTNIEVPNEITQHG